MSWTAKFRQQKILTKCVILICVGVYFPLLVIRAFREHKGDKYCEKIIQGLQEGNLEDLSSFLNSYDVVLNYDDFDVNVTYRDYLNCLPQDNMVLSRSIEMYYLKEPSTLPYEMMFVPPHDVTDASTWFSPDRENPVSGEKCGAVYHFPHGSCSIHAPHTLANFIDDRVFKRRASRGFFVESRSHGGDITESVSILFEVHYNWTGLLVEPMPNYFKNVMKKHRKTYAMNACLATSEYPNYYMVQMNNLGEVDYYNSPYDENMQYNIDNYIKLQCFPMYSMLRALGNPTVNLWVLIANGNELAVLKTIPWNKVDIEVISVRTKHFTRKILRRKEIIALLKSKGYSHLPAEEIGMDDVFVSKKAVSIYRVKL